MARPIKETPILFEKDAKRFEKSITNPPKEYREVRSLSEANYYVAMSTPVKQILCR